MMGHVTAVPGPSRADTHLAERLERPKVGARQLSGGRASYNQQWGTQAPRYALPSLRCWLAPFWPASAQASLAATHRVL